MAKKKLNKRFAKVLAAVMAVAVAGSVGVYAYSRRKKESPVKYDVAAQVALQQNNLEDALNALTRSVSLAPSAEKWVKIGEIKRRLSLQKPELLIDVLPAYEQALTIDPGYEPGLRAVVATYADFAQVAQLSPTQYSRWRGYAVRLAKAEPNDSFAKAMIPISTVQGWLRRVDVDPKQLESDLGLLAQVVAEDPTNADAFGCLSGAYSRQLVEAQQGRRDEEAADKLKALKELVTRAVSAADGLVSAGGSAVASGAATQSSGGATTQASGQALGNEQNGAKALAIYYRAVSPYVVLAQFEPAQARQDLAKVKEVSDKALALAKPGRPLYFEANYTAAQVARQFGKRDEADRIFKSALAALPGDQRLRLEYAKFLKENPATLDDAIALLAKPVEVSDTGNVAAGQVGAQSAAETRYLLDSTRMDRVGTLGTAPGSADEAKRQELLTATEADVQKMLTEAPDNPFALTMAGRIAMAKGDAVRAVGQLGLARAAYDRKDLGQREEYRQLLRYLAEAYIRTSQVGLAKQTLADLVARDNVTRRDLGSRLRYVDLLLQEGTPESSAEVLKQMAELKAIAPNHPEVVRREGIISAEQAANTAANLGMRAAAATRSAGGAAAGAGGVNPAEAAAAEKLALQKYQSLPETSKTERAGKAALAMKLGNQDEAIRLLSAAYFEDPSDVNMALRLASVQVSAGKTNDALATVAAARKAKPEDVTLQVYELQLKKAPKEEQEAAVLAGIGRISNPVEKQLAYFDYYQRNGNAAKASEALKAAEAADPKDARVNDKLFTIALAEKRLDDAEKYLGVLTAANADNVGGRLYRFQFLTAKRDLDGALLQAKELTKLYPDFAAAWETLAAAQSQTGDLEGARSSWEQVLQRQPKNAKAYKGLIGMDYALNRPTDAGEAIVRAISEVPGDGELQEMRVFHELRFGETEKAIKVIEASAARVPERLDVQARLGSSYVEAAGVMRARGDSEKAKDYADKGVEVLKKVVEASPSADEVAKMTEAQRSQTPEPVSAMAALSRAALMTDAPGEVEGLLKKTADKQPATSYAAELVLAEYYASTGKTAEAEATAQDAVKRGGGAAQPREVVAGMLTRMGKADEALAVLDGISDEKARGATLGLRAELLIRSGKAEAAEKMLKDALAAKPEDPAMNALLTFILIQKESARQVKPEEKKYAEATRQIEAMLQRDPSNADALFFRAQVQMLVQGGDVKAAIRDLQVVKNRGGMPVDRQMLLVQAYTRDNDMPSAMRELQDVVRQAPDDRDKRLQLLAWMAQQRPTPLAEIKSVVEDGLARPALAHDGELLMARARVAAQEKDAAAAEKYGKAALASAKNSPQAVVTYANVMLSVDRPQEVMTVTQPLVDSGKAEYWTYLKRGEAEKKLGNGKGAEGDYLKALELGSRDSSGGAALQVAESMLQNLGLDSTLGVLSSKLDQAPIYRVVEAVVLMGPLQISVKNNDAAGVDKYGRQAVGALEPLVGRIKELSRDEQAMVLKQMATLLVMEGPQQNYDRAAELYRQLLQPELTPDDLGALNNVAFILSEKVSPPRVSEALAYSTRALKVLSTRPDPVDPLVYDTHGWIQVLSGQLLDGISTLKQAVGKQSFVEGHYHLGMAYLKLADQSQGDARLTFARQAADQADRAMQLQSRAGVTSDKDYETKVSNLMKDAGAMVAKESGR